jgi:hypothetical protein
MIPAIAHVIWLGSALSPVAWLTVRAALARSGLTVRLHTDQLDLLAGHPLVQELLTHDGFELHALTAVADPALDELDHILPGPAARADVWRLRLLAEQGGLYLDADAITVRDLRPLLMASGFAGLERVALPAAVTDSRNPLRWLKAGALLAVRHVASQLPDPGAAFAPLAPLYALACNNAVLGAEPGHPLLLRLLDRIRQMPRSRALRLYELGPRLLEAETGNVGTPEFHLHPPEVFFPLAPEVCVGYARPATTVTLPADTFVAHLYDSVLARRVGPLDAAWLTGPARGTLLGQLVAPWLDDLAALSSLVPPPR